MEASIKQHIEECTKKSNMGTSTFPEVIAALKEAGVESYFTDYRKGENTYYTRQGDTCNASLNLQKTNIPMQFDADALQAAIRAAQRDEIRYPEFKKRSMAAGCVGYFVWLEGKQVNYFGHYGEMHVEKFPK